MFIYTILQQQSQDTQQKTQQQYVRNEFTREYKQVGVERAKAMEERNEEGNGGGVKRTDISNERGR
jgi:hypothetical protein